jgi:hypothetical protein
MPTLGQRLALSSAWWSWDSQVIRKALWASVLTRLRQLGNERLKENGSAGRFPSEWRDLEFLRREIRTQKRVLDGKTNLCPELLLGYASLLGINTTDCFPPTHTWIAEATVYLSQYAQERVRPVTMPDACVYAHSVLPIVASRSLTAMGIEAQLARLPAPTVSLVRSVADAIAPILEAHDPELRSSSKRST